VVVTMGCGDACPPQPGTRDPDWELDHPPPSVRRIRDEIDLRVRRPLAELVPGSGPHATRRPTSAT
jgi:hypothetical protein